MTLTERWLVADTADLVPPLIERIASRLVEAIELDELSRADGAERGDRSSGAASLAADARRQQLLVGAWLSEELATINQIRLAGGERPLDPISDRSVRARVVADLTGAGPLEPYINDASGRRDRRQLARVDLGHIRRRAQGRRRGVVDVGRRADRLPEAPCPTDDPHRRGTPRHLVADVDVPGHRWLPGRDGARRCDRTRHLDPPSNRHPSLRGAPRRPAAGWPAWACFPRHSCRAWRRWCGAGSRSSCPAHRAPARRRC